MTKPVNRAGWAAFPEYHGPDLSGTRRLLIVGKKGDGVLPTLPYRSLRAGLYGVEEAKDDEDGDERIISSGIGGLAPTLQALSRFGCGKLPAL